MENLIELIKKICLISSPTGHELKKATFIKKWLEQNGAKNAIIDEKSNVIFQYGNKEKPKIVFMAHIDTVYPAETKLEIWEDEEVIKCPGVGDNSSNVAGLMLVIKHIIKNKIVFNNHNIFFVFSACEEGLGNSDGCRYFMKKHDNIKEFIAVDGTYNSIISKAVGSHRYEINVFTKGGHSFGAFGNENAIHILSQMIIELYKIKLPEKEESVVTYNVGAIKGGTTINSIAASAGMLYEYRSDDHDCLFYMKQKLDKIIKKYQKRNCEIEIKLIGERPCSKGVDKKDHENLLNKIEKISTEVLSKKLLRRSGSTDSNIPLSMGIPASNISVYLGKGSHSAKEETLYKNSLKAGMEIVMNFVLSYR